MNFDEYKDIYVFVEQRDGKIWDVSYELIGEARKLVNQIHHVDYKVVAILMGNEIKDKAQELIYYGADKVIVTESYELIEYHTENFALVLEHIIKQFKPDALLIGATVMGRDLAPRVAARVNTGLTADATILEIDKEQENSTLLWVTRPAFGGNLFGTIICPNHRPQMATIRPNVFDIPKRDKSRTGEIIEFPVEVPSDSKVKIMKVIEKVEEGIDISKADIIISDGRGVGNRFDILKEVANEIGGVVGASRAAVDEGYATKDMQVGQTGKTVKPRLYIACGISGAVQHVAGMDKSDFIIAINKDPEAAIFNCANVGIVGDALAILPLLKDEIKNLR
ncbi:electron transfer flavoprotein subunit alpha/FixB family protein [Mycoplasmatota bacterium]|nr:electron transfer flavoprotein subunit alpha/FixB family protein [Mycoplasmatota bacterium]